MRYVLPLFATLLLVLSAPDAAVAQGHDEDREDRTERRERAQRRSEAERGERRSRRGRAERGRRGRTEHRKDERRRRGGGQWERSGEQRRDGDWNSRRRRGGGEERGGGPPFCRNGEGHPVHGRQWCIEKGFGLGGGGYYGDGRYGDGRYGDGRYGDGRYGDGRYGDGRWRRVDARGIAFRTGFLDRVRGQLDEEALVRVLGRETLYRLRDHQRSLRLSGRLRGEFERGLTDILTGEEEERILRVFARGGKVAHFIDVDGDDRVDHVYLRRR